MKNEKGQLKSATGYKIANTFKKVGTKILLGLIALGIAIGGTLTFVGCDKDKTPQTPNPPSYVEPENPGGEIDPENPGGDIEIQEKTYQDFLQSGLADVFVDGFAPKALAQKGELWGKEYFVTGHDNVVTGINFLYIYGDPATENRTIEIANLKFTSDLDVDDILTDINLSTSYKLSTQKVMEFNAKTNKLNPDIANALYNAANLKNQTLKLFQEVENNREGYRTFTLFTQNGDNSIQLVELTVESDETNLLENLANSAKVTVKNGKTYLNDDNKMVYNEEYTLDEEDYKPEEVGPGGEIDPNPGPGGDVDIDKVTNEEILQAFEANRELSEYLFDNSAIAQAQRVNFNNILNESWHLVTSEDGKTVTGFEYEFLYKQQDTNYRYEVLSIDFKSPITKESLKDMSFEYEKDLKITTKYNLNYNPTIQETNKDLTNAIFTALGVADTGATRIIIETNRGGVGDAEFGQYSSYKVVEISNNEVKEYDVTVKYAADMVEQVEKGNIRKDAEQTTEINGSKLTAETESKQEDVSSIYSNDMWKISLYGEEFTF